MKARRGLRRRSAGLAAVEFALVFPLFLSLSVGTLELAGLYSAWSNLQWACDRAARQMMVSSAPTQDGAQAAAVAVSRSAGYPAAQFMASGPAPCAAGSGTNCITISGSYPYSFQAATLGMFSVTLTASAVAPLT